MKKQSRCTSAARSRRRRPATERTWHRRRTTRLRWRTSLPARCRVAGRWGAPYGGGGRASNAPMAQQPTPPPIGQHGGQPPFWVQSTHTPPHPQKHNSVRGSCRAGTPRRAAAARLRAAAAHAGPPARERGAAALGRGCRRVRARVREGPPKCAGAFGSNHEWRAASTKPRAVRRSPGEPRPAQHRKPQMLLDLARALKELDRTAAAAEAYTRALELAPDHPRAHFKLAMALRAMGRMGRAAEHFRCGGGEPCGRRAGPGVASARQRVFLCVSEVVLQLTKPRASACPPLATSTQAPPGNRPRPHRRALLAGGLHRQRRRRGGMPAGHGGGPV